jgi:hypothetical protein
MAEFDGARYEISSVISRSFETISANFVIFVGLALVLSGIPNFVLQMWQGNAVLAAGTGDPNLGFSLAFWTPFIITSLVAMVTNAVLQASLTRAAVLHLSGETPGFAQCLTVGLSMILPMIGIGILTSFGVGFATLLLIVPGIILWLAWSVVVPVYVQEKVGVFGAFSRSMELTSGSRWRIFLTFLILVIGLWLLSIPASFLVGIGTSTGSIVVTSLLSAAISALGGMVMVSVQSCVYVELRDVKEGVAPSELEAIFA